MYLIWSKNSIKLGDDFMHCFIFDKNLDKVKFKLKNLCSKLKINIDYDDDNDDDDDIDCNDKDKSLDFIFDINIYSDNDKDKLLEFICVDDTIIFSRIHCESNFYYTKIDDLDNKRYIYTFEFHESGEGQSYHEECYLSW